MAIEHGGNVSEIAAKYHLNEKEIIDFSANINPLGTPLEIKEALLGEFDKITHYPDSSYSQLKKALASFHRLSVEEIYPGNGASEVIYQLAACVNVKRLLLLAPTFQEYSEAFRNYGTSFYHYYLEQNDFNFIIEDFIQEAKEQQVDGICLCNPNNPTGQLIEKLSLLKLLDFCQQQQIHLIIDEAFIDFAAGERGSLVDRIRDYPRLYIIRSLTKMYALPGLRLGYLVTSNHEIINQMNARTPSWHINALADLAGRLALQNPEFTERTRALIDIERTFLLNELRRFEGQVIVHPGTANFLFFKWQGEHCLQERLIKKQLLIRKCDSFHGLKHNYYRIAVKGRKENQRLIQALEEVLCEK